MAAAADNDNTYSRYIEENGTLKYIEKYGSNDDLVSKDEFRYNKHDEIEGKATYDADGKIISLDIYHYDDHRLSGIDHLDYEGASIGTDIYNYNDDGSIASIDHYDSNRYCVSTDYYEDGAFDKTVPHDKELRVVDVEIYGDKSRDPDSVRQEYWNNDGKIEYARERVLDGDGVQKGDMRMIRLEDGNTVESRVSTGQVNIRVYDDQHRLSDELTINKDGVSFKTYSYDSGKQVGSSIPMYTRGDRIIMGNTGNSGFFDANIRIGQGVSTIRSVSEHYAAKMSGLSDDITQKYNDIEHDIKTVGIPYRPEERPEESFLKNGDISSVVEFDEIGKERQVTHFEYEDGRLVKVECFDLQADDRSTVYHIDNEGNIDHAVKVDGDDVTEATPEGIHISELYPDYFDKEYGSPEDDLEKTDERVVIVYDEDHKPLTETRYDEEDKIFARTEYTYDKNGDIMESESEYYDSEGNIEHREVTEYDEDGEKTYIYDDKGNLLTTESEDKDSDPSENEPEAENSETEKGKAVNFKSGDGTATEYRTSDDDMRADEWHSFDGKSFSYGICDENDGYKEFSYDSDEGTFVLAENDADGNTLFELKIELIDESDYEISCTEYHYDDKGVLIESDEADIDISEDGKITITSPVTGEEREFEFERESDNLGLDLKNRLENDIKAEIEEIKEDLGIEDKADAENENDDREIENDNEDIGDSEIEDDDEDYSDC